MTAPKLPPGAVKAQEEHLAENRGFYRAMIEGKSTPEPNTGCWLWEKNFDQNGYGRLWLGRIGRVYIFAHRASVIAFHGTNISGLCICHKCDTPACVNPDHLFTGTHADNHADRGAKNRTARGENNGQSVLTGSAVLGIRSDKAAGMPSIEIAKKYSVNDTTISSICRGNTWTHVGGHLIRSKPRRVHSAEERALAREMALSGMSMQKIGKQLGVGASTVCRWIHATA